jgi:hypothetical protein
VSAATATPYVWKLKGGAVVHGPCRESYVKAHTTSHFYPSIEAALHPGYPMRDGRFQLCAHCQRPIWDAPAPVGVPPHAGKGA